MHDNSKYYVILISSYVATLIICICFTWNFFKEQKKKQLFSVLGEFRTYVHVWVYIYVVYTYLACHLPIFSKITIPVSVFLIPTGLHAIYQDRLWFSHKMLWKSYILVVVFVFLLFGVTSTTVKIKFITQNFDWLLFLSFPLLDLVEQHLRHISLILCSIINVVGNFYKNSLGNIL